MLVRAVIAFLLLLTAPGALPAAAPAAGDPGRFDVDSRGAIPAAAPDRRMQEQWSRSPAWRSFAARNGDWVVRWDERRGVPLRATGPGKRVGPPPADDTAARLLAEDFLRAEARTWTRGEDLRVVRTHADGGGWWIHEVQVHEGVRVVGSRVSLRVGRDGSVPSFTLDVHPDLDLAVTPSIPEAEAQRAAIDGLPSPVDLDLTHSELVILPVQAPGHDRYVLAYEMDIRSTGYPGAWRAYVDAGDGSLVWRYSTLRASDLGGTITTTIEPVQIQDQLQIRALRHAGLQVVDAEGDTVGSAVTNSSGVYALTTEAAGPHTLRVPLGGPFGMVLNFNNKSTQPVAEIPVNLGVDAAKSFTFDDSNSLVEDRDAFYSAMTAHDYIRTVEPGFDDLDYPMPITTDITGYECNAFWDGVGINFFPAGPNCTNTARSASVVIHEYGHGITDFQYRPFSPSPAMHEGFSDYYSATVLDDPTIGHGFFGRGTRIRTIDNHNKAPDDITGEPHNDGLIIAAACWDVRRVLGPALADSLWHYARYGYSDNYDDYLLDYLLVDDDDGNIYNGTPHFQTIIAAFRAHGIGDYDVHISHEEIADTENLANTFPLTATVLSLFALDESTVQVHLRIEHGGTTTEETRVLAPGGGTREFTTLLDAQPADTEVRYWFTASDTSGATAVLPPNGAAAPFRFRVGTDVSPPVIAHEALGDQPADTDALRLFATVEDNLDQPAGTPQLVFRRNGEGPLSEPFVPASAGRWEAQIPFVSLVPGDTYGYQIEVEDGAAAPNLGVFPESGDLSFAVVRGMGRELETDNGGLSGSGIWQWGTPTAGREAYSGDKVWATVLGGNYPGLAVDSLLWGPFDLSTYTKAGLFFRNTFDTEEFWDGGTVFASRNQGKTWELIHPDGDYPAPRIYGNQKIAAQGRPGYSGTQDGWERAAFDLSAFLGEPEVRIKFEFVSDEAVSGAGWFLDDVQLMERQVFARPEGLSSRSGRDGRVPLAWEPPPGVPVDGPHAPIRGYAVYRTGDFNTWTRLNDDPVTGSSYQDETAVNGLYYGYAVTALYDDGESERSGSTAAIPYLADLAAGPEEITLTLRPGMEATGAVTVTNTGTGFLRATAWRGLPGMTLDDVRIRYRLPASYMIAGKPVKAGAGAKAVPAQAPPALEPAVAERIHRMLAAAGPMGGRNAAGENATSTVGEPVGLGTAPAGPAIPPPGEYEVLFSDPSDHADGSVPDLATIEAQTSDKSLFLRVTSHRAWGSPSSQFNLLIALDTDDDLTTGVNGDVLLLAGAISFAQFQGPAVILDGTTLELIGTPHYLILSSGATSAEFGFFLSTLGNPEEVVIRVAAANAPGNAVLDYLPNVVPAPWLQLPSPSVAVFQGGSSAIPVQLVAGAVKGRYEGLVLVDANTALGEYSIPVTLEVEDPQPVVLADFRAEAEDLGVVVRWRTTDESGHAGFHLYRDDAPPGHEVRLTTSLILPDGRGLPDGTGLSDGTGEYRWFDDGVEPGRDYLYRLEDVARDGAVTSHGPVLVRFAGAAALTHAVLRQNAPNPVAATTSIRFGLPAPARVRVGIYSMTGRLVRTLAEGDYPAGFHQVNWDGRDDLGRRVGAGVYTYLLESPLGGDRRKLVVTR